MYTVYTIHGIYKLLYGRLSMFGQRANKLPRRLSFFIVTDEVEQLSYI
jgi:hypothetical protein